MMKFFQSFLLVLVFPAICISGCGGGGGSSASSASSASTVEGIATPSSAAVVSATNN